MDALDLFSSSRDPVLEKSSTIPEKFQPSANDKLPFRTLLLDKPDCAGVLAGKPSSLTPLHMSINVQVRHALPILAHYIFDETGEVNELEAKPSAAPDNIECSQVPAFSCTGTSRNWQNTLSYSFAPLTSRPLPGCQYPDPCDGVYKRTRLGE